MEKRGLAPTDKDGSQFSYYLSFSNNIDWVTLSSPDFELDNDSIVETQKISKALKTTCVETSVFDSDWAIIKLYDYLSKNSHTVAIGRAEEFLGESNTSEKGVRECWSPLLAEGKTWDELTKIWNDDYTFIEDALEKTAPFFGMDFKNIRADYRVFEGNPDNFNTVVLYFKSHGEAFIKEGPTKIHSPGGSIPISGEEGHYSFYNSGGISSGL